LFLTQNNPIPELKEEGSTIMEEFEGSNSDYSPLTQNIGVGVKPTIIDIMKPEDGAKSYREMRQVPIYQSYQHSDNESYFDSNTSYSLCI